jgi:hypothetical protein
MCIDGDDAHPFCEDCVDMLLRDEQQEGLTNNERR